MAGVNNINMSVKEASDTVYGDGAADTLFTVAYDGVRVAASSDSNHHAYSGEVEPACTFIVNADFGVRVIPLIGGMLKTSQVYTDIYIHQSNLSHFLNILPITFHYF